ncbi:hypothetical protein, partial [Streptococcus merionis]|uniref:hypothetical protein n=1 Tax=Streptococcus merionis TaxID=400065 RepID=UPI0035170AE8
PVLVDTKSIQEERESKKIPGYGAVTIFKKEPLNIIKHLITLTLHLVFLQVTILLQKLAPTVPS